MSAPVVAVGECMLELARRDAHDRRLGPGWQLGFAGDTFNTALYMRRLGVPVAYLTALGVDPYSEEMLADWCAEGIGDSLVLRHPTRMPGLYAIRTDAAGERSFHYWRSQSAVRELFSLPGIDAALSAAAQAELLYLSGISLSLFDAHGRARLSALARAVRAHGGKVAFDPNYRPAGWPDADAARAAIIDMASAVNIVLPTLDDERRLWGSTDSEQSTAQRWLRYGAEEVVLKLGAEGCLIATPSGMDQVPAERVARVVDTTGAGDSFNAAYLAGRRAGASAIAAALAGHRLAAQVIQHPGAILPR